MNFDTSKNLSGIGAILMFISVIGSFFIPFGGGILGLIGLILLLIGVRGLADYYREHGIFNNMLYGVLTGIVGGVVAVAVLVALVLTSLTSFLYKVFPGWNGDYYTLSGMTPNFTNISFTDFVPFIIAGIAVFVILFIVTIVIAIFFRRSFSLLRTKSGIGLFGTTGIILLLGAVLTIILVGFLLIWIAVLLLAIAFFELKPQSMPPSAQSTMPPPQTSM